MVGAQELFFEFTNKLNEIVQIKQLPQHLQLRDKKLALTLFILEEGSKQEACVTLQMEREG